MTTAFGTARPRVVIVGLDGATFNLLDPLGRAGALPALDSLRWRGTEAVLRSTVPTYTPPAWVSMATGVNPGRHGIFGFLANTPQEPTVVAHSGLIKAPAIWHFLNDLGLRAGVFHLPMSYPPTKLDGFMVSGGLAAGWTQPELPNFTSDPSIGQLVTRVGGSRYAVDTQVNYEKDWRTPATVSEIARVQRQRRKVLAALLEEVEVDFLFAVFEGPDRLMHVHYQYIVECSDWYTRPEAGEIRDLAFSYFAELDRTIADLVEWAGPEGHVVVVSDHGFGPWEKTVNINLLLKEWGFLPLPSISRLTQLRGVAGGGQRLARRVVPRRLLHRLRAGVSSRIAWDQTRAFASHVAEQGIHVNERGRMPKGIVDHDEAGRIESDLIGRLHSLIDPDDGQPVIDTVVRRADVVHGPYAWRSPDLFPFCRDQRYELSDTLAASSPISDHRDRPWGYHHRDGIFIAAGSGTAHGRFESGLDIVDVLPTVFHLGGIPVPTGADGRVVDGVMSPAARARPVVRSDAVSGHEASAEYPFSAEEELAIEESLRGLGYIE